MNQQLTWDRQQRSCATWILEDGEGVIAHNAREKARGADDIWVVLPNVSSGKRFEEILSKFLKLLQSDGGLEVSIVPTALDAGPIGTVILPVLSAVWVAAETLTAGTDAAAALGLWCDDTAALLEVVRRQRRRFIPVDIEKAVGDPKAFCAAINQRCGLALQTDASVLTREPRAGVDALRDLVAQAIVDRQPRVQALLPEVEAATLSLDLLAEGAEPVDLSKAWHELVSERAATASLKQKFKTLGAVSDELYAKIHHQQLEIETLFLTSKSAVENETLARNELRDSLTASGKRITALMTEVEGVRRDSDKAQHMAQRDLRSLQDRLDAQTAEMARIQDEALSAAEILNQKVVAQGERINAMTAEMNHKQARGFVEQQKAEEEIAVLEDRVAELVAALEVARGGMSGLKAHPGGPQTRSTNGANQTAAQAATFQG